MHPHDVESVLETHDIEELFRLSETDSSTQIFKNSQFTRNSSTTPNQDTVILDSFPDADGTSCCFLRLSPGKTRTVRLVVHDTGQLESCSSGGWLLKPGEATLPSYWIPRTPMLRTLDSSGRILSESPATIVGFGASQNALTVIIEINENMCLDLTVWRLDSREPDIQTGLEQPLVLEKQPIFLWNSQTTYQALADIYLYLVHGQVYVNRFVWPRKWKICSELDAYELFVTLSGLENSTQNKLYNLIKRQILFSVIGRQAKDGGWYHGEWTDAMESHYRFHNGAVLLLEAALEERSDDVVHRALERAASFLSLHTDKTDLGVWFLHDSLEDSVEGMNAGWEQTGGRWIPSRILGKSITNKMILNTHLDSIVTLDRYQEVTGDDQYAECVGSARSATMKLLALRPAEQLYRLIYQAIGLTLLPASEAKRLPFAKRAIKRLTWKYLLPKLYLIKKSFPRVVMPGGIIERHLAPPHWSTGYFPVNIMDLARFWRRFPEEDLADIINEAVKAVSETSFLQYCAEIKPRQYALVVYIDALYQLYTTNQTPTYRRYLAEAILCAEDTGLGLPPSALGADPEVIRKVHQIPCPSPKEKRLRVVNLSNSDRHELLVVNSSATDLDLELEGITSSCRFDWLTAEGQPASTNAALSVPPRGWIWGRGS
jgi:hypothetical protein